MSEPAPKETRHCIHCGAEIPRGVEGDFCCSGCSHVYQIIHESGLEQYYEYRDKRVDPVGERVFRERDFTELSDWQTQQESIPGAEVATGRLKLQGISCAGCVWLVERIFQRQGGAIDIRIDPQSGDTELRWQRGLFKVEQFAQESARFAYFVELSEEPPKESKRGLGTRVGLCAAFAMCSIGFSLPKRFESADNLILSNVLELLIFLSTCLSLLVGGSYFFKNTWRSLQIRVIHADLLIGLGLIIMVAGCTAGVILGAQGPMAFELIPVFVFLLLGGRWLQERILESVFDRNVDTPHLNKAILKHSPDRAKSERFSLNQIVIDDRLVVPPDEMLPVESLLESGECKMRHPWISGESESITYLKGDRVPAGAINETPFNLTFRAAESWSNSIARKVYSKRDGADNYDPRIEKLLHTYLLAMLATAMLGGFTWTLFDQWSVGVSVSVSVLIISLSWIIANAWPAMIDFCVRTLREQGVFIRDPHIWSALSGIDYVVFDTLGESSTSDSGGNRGRTIDGLKTEVLGAMSPEAQARRIQEIGPKRTMMVGDGLANALAFQTARVQGAPISGNKPFNDCAAFCFTGDKITGVSSLVRFAATLKSAERAVFYFALFYHLLALLFCIFGVVAPTGAAVIMPVGSILTILVGSAVLRIKMRDCFDRLQNSL